MSYATDTTVSVDRSRAEIERTLERFGATEFVFGWDKAHNVAVLGFAIHGRRMRLRLELPDQDDPQFAYKKINRSNYRERRAPEQQKAAHEQACRERWRALALLIKAKLAAIEAGITTMEDVFLSDMLLPDQRTAGEWLKPQMDHVYETGQMPPLLPMLTPQLEAPDRSRAATAESERGEDAP